MDTNKQNMCTEKEIRQLQEALQIKEAENKKLNNKIDRVCNDTEYKKKILDLEKKLQSINVDRSEIDRERKLRKSLQAKIDE